MSEQIKSLADEIREKLRLEMAGETPGPDAEATVAVVDLAPDTEARPVSSVYTQAQVTRFFQQLEAFHYAPEQKSMIRVDARTMKSLRRLKLVRGVEMNKFIVFALHQLLARNPWLADYIQDSLKNPDL